MYSLNRFLRKILKPMAIFTGVPLAALSVFESPTVGRTVISVRADKPGITISPNLWGIFFEELNYAGQGGIYAQYVRDGTFKWPSTQKRPFGWWFYFGPGGDYALNNGIRPAGWHLALENGARGRLSVDYNHPLNMANTVCARVDVYRHVPAVNDGVSLINSGFWGMNFRKSARYNLTFYARRSPGMGSTLKVELLGSHGAVLASKIVRGVNSRWSKFSTQMVSSGNDPQGRLAIFPQGHGVLFLDLVSLFPCATWRHQTNGFRPYLMRMLRRLHPSFVRFPGGNYIEGDSLPDSFSWQKTVGPLSGRPGHWSPWGYWCTDGLGYLEMLELCQDLHATALFGFNCGISLGANDVVPMDKMGPWVRSAAAAIQYTTAPLADKWGARRAADGHPTPFHLGWLEIGNESWGQLDKPYAKRYAVFSDSLHKKFPGIKLIYSGTPKLSKAPIQIVDQHFYNSPKWFWTHRNMFNQMSRSGPKILVGEYAVTRRCGHGNLRAALAEAAFMSGIEKNSDLVRMACYAPLLVNVHYRQWNPDLIEFDGHRACGTPSYWVQEMFATNRCSRMLSLRLSSPPISAKIGHLRRFTAIAGVAAPRNTIIITVVNGTSRPVKSEVDVRGMPAPLKGGRIITLTAPSLGAENTLSRPNRVRPVKAVLAITHWKFQYVFPARSLVVIRLSEIHP